MQDTTVFGIIMIILGIIASIIGIGFEKEAIMGIGFAWIGLSIALLIFKRK
jgi:hypothetical protein